MNNDKPDCEIKEISDDLKLLGDYVQIWTSVSSLGFVLCALVNNQLNSGLFLAGTVIFLAYHTLCKLLLKSARKLVAKSVP